jgi:hypothetical protein
LSNLSQQVGDELQQRERISGCELRVNDPLAGGLIPLHEAMHQRQPQTPELPGFFLLAFDEGATGRPALLVFVSILRDVEGAGAFAPIEAPSMTPDERVGLSPRPRRRRECARRALHEVVPEVRKGLGALSRLALPRSLLLVVDMRGR